MIQQQQQLPMAASMTAQNPAAQQMLAQFMNGSAGQSIVPQRAMDTQVKQGGKPLTAGNVIKNAVLQTRTLMDPAFQVQQYQKGGMKQLGNDLKEGDFLTTTPFRKTDVIDSPTTSLQNNAPKIDWSSMIQPQQQQAQIQQPKTVQFL